jgi:cysteine desulfurase
MIYLDYAATAPLRPTIAERIAQLNNQVLGNPSSLHRAGREARMVLEQARESCAVQLGAKVEEIVFCSGATEADNLAILGALTHGDTAQKHLITSHLEHAAVFETVKRQEQLGRFVHWLPVEPTGIVDLAQLKCELERHPESLVSVMIVNNEVGTRQPVQAIGELCREHGALFHADGVQDPKAAKALIESGLVDLVALSGHKMGGLHGGLLYVKQGVPINPQIVGGSQEDGRRAGTSEVIRAESLSLALWESVNDDGQRVASCRSALEESLRELPGAVRLGPESRESRADHISAWLFADLPAEPILVSLDMKGICASSGSACSSHSVEPSRVVKAMGYSDEQASGLVRFSFGWQTTVQEVQKAAELVKEIVLRMMSKERKRR